MNRTAIIGKLTTLGVSLVKNDAEKQNLRWQIAEFSFKLRDTYPAGSEKAFLATAATAAKLTEGDIGNLVRAYEVRQDLTKVQAEKTADWTTDAVLTLRGKDMNAGNRTKLITKAEKKGTRNVKDLRTFKKGIVSATPRNRQNATDAKIAFVKKNEKLIERLLKSHDSLALIAGAQFAQDNPGVDVSAAITFAAAQVTKATAPTS
jgi:hypothetical protein